MVKKIGAKRVKGNAAPSAPADGSAGAAKGTEVIAEGVIGPGLDFEATAVCDLLQVDLRDPEAIKAFRARYPVRASSTNPVEPAIDDLRRAYALTTLLGQTLLYGNAEAWERVNRAHATMRRMEGLESRRLKCVGLLRWAVELWRSDPEAHERVTLVLLRELPFLDGSFRKLTNKGLVGVLNGAFGRPATEALSMAAELSIFAGAFGDKKKENETDRAVTQKRIYALFAKVDREAREASDMAVKGVISG